MRGIMKNFIILLFLIVIIFSYFSKAYSDLKPYDGEEFDLISKRFKFDKTRIPGSGYVQRKPDPLNVLTKKLVLKCKKYVVKFGLERTISLINEKPRKFRDFKTYLFIIDVNGNVLAHSGNPLFAGNNMMTTKNSIGRLFIQDYINKLHQVDQINYFNIITLEDNVPYIYNFVYLEKLNDNLIIGAVATP